MLALYTRIKNCYDDESGQTMVEYALMVALVALVVAVAFPPVTDAIKAVIQKAADQLNASIK